MSNRRQLPFLSRKRPGNKAQSSIDLDSRGFPPRLADVEDMANILLAERDAGRDAGRDGKNWASKFVKRQPDLKTRFNCAYDYKRALCEDPVKIQTWFASVQDLRAKFDIVDTDVFNVDETGFSIPFGACHNHGRGDHVDSKASLVKVVLHRRDPRLYRYRVFAECSLIVVGTIETRLEVGLSFNKLGCPILPVASRVASRVTLCKQNISHNFNICQSRREISRVQVEDVSKNSILFSLAQPQRIGRVSCRARRPPFLFCCLLRWHD